MGFMIKTNWNNSTRFFFAKNLMIVIFVTLLFNRCLDNMNIVTFSYLFNGVLLIVLFLNSFEIQKISLAIIHYFFLLLFFVFVPLNQYLDNRFMNYNLEFYSDTILYVNLLILTWVIVFFLGYKVTQNFIGYKISLVRYKNYTFYLPFAVYMVGFVIILLTIFNGDLGSLLLKGLHAENPIISFDNQPFQLLYGKFYKPLLLILFFYFYVLKENFHINNKTLIVLFFIAIGLNFPLAVSRYYAFVIILLFYVIFFMKQEKNSLSIVIYLLFGIFMSAVFELFRYLNKSVSEFSFNINYFYVGHFDSYENFLHTYNYVQENLIDYGRSLFGAILFFIPRSIWSSKPIGSGAFLAENYIEGARNTNIANSAISEYFFNFGILGILIFAFFYGVVFSILDDSAKDYISGKKNTVEDRLFLILYVILLGMLLFHLRGDMMSSVAYTTGLVMCVLVSNYVFGFKFTISNKRF